MRRAYIELHTAVLLFGITAILGKLISLEAIPLVWWRVLLASSSFILLINLRKTFRTLPRKRILQFTGIGLIVAAHWITFFGSIKLANASVALAAFSTQSFFTAIIEPLIVGYRMRMQELLIGLLIVPAMLLIVSGIDLSMYAGLVVGLVSSVLAAVFSSINKRIINTATPLQVSFFELSGAWIGITLFAPFVFYDSLDKFIPEPVDFAYLAILSFGCTTIAYVLAMRALRYLTAFASNLTINLEPIYGIVLAWLILNENQELGPNFYLGCGILLAAVFSYPLLRRYQRRKAIPNNE